MRCGLVAADEIFLQLLLREAVVEAGRKVLQTIVFVVEAVGRDGVNKRHHRKPPFPRRFGRGAHLVAQGLQLRAGAVLQHHAREDHRLVLFDRQRPPLALEVEILRAGVALIHVEGEASAVGVRVRDGRAA